MKTIIATVAVTMALASLGETNAMPRVTHGRSRSAVAARAKANAERRESRAKKAEEKRTKGNKDTTAPLPHQEHRKAMRGKAKQ